MPAKAAAAPAQQKEAPKAAAPAKEVTAASKKAVGHPDVPSRAPAIVPFH